jgi:peptidoglycan/LPS O-acetylase OafA/YrhL
MAADVKRQRLDALTSLRWFAAFAVLLRHIWGRTDLVSQAGTIGHHFFRQGVVGVSFFFILSGFVLTWSHVANDTPRSFYGRRIARIYPAYAVAAACTALLFISQHRSIGGRGIFTFTLLQAWVPKGTYHFALNSVSWSLSVEMFFYLAFPFVLPIVMRVPLNRRRVLMALCVLGPLLIAVGLRPHPGDTSYWFMYVFPPVRMLEFVAGILLALEVRDGTWPRLALLPAIVIALGGYVAAGYVPEPLMWTAIAVAPFIALIGAVAQANVATPTGVLHLRPLVWLGEASYAFYLVHLTVIEFLLDHVSGKTTGLLALPLGIAAAALLHELIETPFERRLRPRLSGVGRPRVNT